MPSSILQQYKSLLLSNLSSIQTVESTLRNVTWFLPGRFEDAEVASEGLYALLNIVSGYHDTLLSRHLNPSLSLPPHPFGRRSASAHEVSQGSSSALNDANLTQVGPSSTVRLSPILPPPSEHTRYTRYWTDRSPTYRKASRLLVTIQYIQLLVEMLSKKRSERRRWKVILGLESVKTALKFLMMGITRRPVLGPAIPRREYDLSSLPSSVLQSQSSDPKPSAQTGNGKPAMASIPPHAPLRSHLLPLSAALPEDHLPHPTSLVPALDTPGYLASELIEVSLTWVHIALLIRASRQTKYRPASLPTLSTNLTPYLVPLLLSLLARRLRPSPTDGPHASLLLADHYAQADRRMAMRTLLTGPMWVGWTRPKIMRLVKGIERVPVVGLVGELMEGYLGLVDDYFYYTSS